MAWLEITIPSTAESISSVTTALTAGGFSDLLIEDQSEFETFFNSYNDRAYRSTTKVVEKAIEEKPNDRCYSIWLRNPGEYPDFSSTCVMNGSISSKTSLESGLVYPVMWINME